MQPVTRWYIRTSFLYLLAALILGVFLALRPLLRLPAIAATLSPVYFHLFLVGWVTQLIFGTIYWLFPKPANERRNEQLAWAAYGLLNSGLLLRAVSEPLGTGRPDTVWGWLLVLSAVLQWLAGLALIAFTWDRTRERPQKRRGGR